MVDKQVRIPLTTVISVMQMIDLKTKRKRELALPVGLTALEAIEWSMKWAGPYEEPNGIYNCTWER